jgi:STE24 endopeptidase
MTTGQAAPALRRLWFLLWGLAVALSLALLFATLPQRGFDQQTLAQFPLTVLERGRQFSREARIVGTAQNLLGLGALLWLCFHRTGVRFVAWLEGLAGGRLWLGLITVAGGITLFLAAVELPFSFYLGFLHEKAYGLSRQTAGGWLADHAVSEAVNLSLMLLYWVPIYWLVRRWPRRWWAPATVFNLALSGLLVFLSPILLLPMQGKVMPVKDPQVLAMIEHLADQAGVEVEAVNEIQVSSRTSRVNAMVTGLGATKQVVFYDTLLQQFRPAEVEVVMAHELAHAINRDVATGWLFAGGAEAAMLCLAAWVLRSMVGVGPLQIDAPHAARGLVLFVLLTTLFGQVTAPVHNVISRRMEVRADQFALEMTRNPAAFIGTFKKLASGNPSDVDPPALVEWLSHSHPSIMNRIRTATEPVQP